MSSRTNNNRSRDVIVKKHKALHSLNRQQPKIPQQIKSVAEATGDKDNVLYTDRQSALLGRHVAKQNQSIENNADYSRNKNPKWRTINDAYYKSEKKILAVSPEQTIGKDKVTMAGIAGFELSTPQQRQLLNQNKILAKSKRE